MRILPRDPFARLAYVWLIYLVFLVPRVRPDNWAIAATLVGIAVFLPLYFWGQWLRGRRALLPIAGITAIAILLSPTNPGAFVFFVYAAAFAGNVGGLRVAATILAGLAIAILVEAWALAMPFQAWGWFLTITVLIGGVVAYSTDVKRRLREAQEQSQYMAVLAERERIGRDLHDLLGHTLSVIALKAELASKLASRNPEQSLKEIREVERISREALAEVRQAVQASRAVLAEELRSARTALQAAGIELVCSVQHVALDPSREQALAFAVREAVTNIVRHSAARRCEVRLDATEQSVRLDVVDDGIGGETAEGSGLSGMRTRVTQLGGRFERVSDPGMRITITLPRAAAATVTPAKITA